MTNRHLVNTLLMLERRASKWLAEEISAAYSFLSGLHGEMAQYYCERDIDSLEEQTPEEWLSDHYPIYNKLLLEAERRQLR